MMDKHQTSAPENQRIYKFIQSYFLLQCNNLSRFRNPYASCWGMIYTFLEVQTGIIWTQVLMHAVYE